MPHITALEISGPWLTLDWSDSRRQTLHAEWLRDNAQGPDAKDPRNGQRLVDVSDVPKGTMIETASLTEDGALGMVFAPDGYTARYDAGWLRGFVDQPAAGDGATCWSGTHAIARFDFETVTTEPEVEAAWLRAIVRDGLALLSGVPCEAERVFSVAALFGYVRETNYGRLFDVRSVADPTNLAYTSQGLMVHTDNPYRNPVPGLQLLHCLQNAEGGASVFVDGFNAARRLRQQDAAAFETLTRVWVPFRFRDGAADLQARAPIITIDDRGNPIAIRYNNRSVAPVDPDRDIVAFYEAYRQFSALLRDPAAELTIEMKPGDCVVFDNERILHGRKSFKQADRWLQGCYADKDALFSRLRVLAVAGQKHG